MIRVLVEQRTVYRSASGKRKGRLTRRAAYLDAAWFAWRTKHWSATDGCGCGCDYDVGLTCGFHNPDGPDPELVAQRRKVIDRLARWLMWRDRKAAGPASSQVATC